MLENKFNLSFPTGILHGRLFSYLPFNYIDKMPIAILQFGEMLHYLSLDNLVFIAYLSFTQVTEMIDVPPIITGRPIKF